MERKIEKALEDYLLRDGWKIVMNGDHYAEWTMGDDEEFSINLTECAKRIAEEIKC